MTRHMTPKRAVDRFLKDKRPNVSDSTHYNHSSLLRQFLKWCDREGLDDITELDGWHVHDFKQFRRDQDGIGEVTLMNQLSVLRVFVRWCESMELVDQGLAERMIMPEPDSVVRDDMLRADVVLDILDYLDTYEYGTMRHAVFAVFWSTGFRIGTVRSLDLGDYHSNDGYFTLHHRPESETPLKNKRSAEREINLHRWVCDVLDDYIEMHRDDVLDDYDRAPLFTTKQGRPVDSVIRDHISSVTRPCHYTNECPHDREISECDATSRLYAQRCPSSVSPHPLRRSAITYWLSEGHEPYLISDRMDVGLETLEKHYDARSESEKRRLRREKFGIDS